MSSISGGQLNAYKHLDEDCPIVIRKEGIRLEIKVPELIVPLMTSNRAVHRLLCLLYHIQMNKYEKEPNAHYAEEYKISANKLLIALQGWEH